MYAQQIFSMIVTMPLSLLVAKLLQLFINIFYGPRSKHFKNGGSVLCYNILMDLKQNAMQPNSIHLFLKKFKKVVDISVIEDSDVSLYCINKKDFVFVRTRRGVDLYNANAHPIFFMVQHETAIELMTVPHAAVFEYVSRKELPPEHAASITLLYNISRCGSTLVTSMVDNTRQRVVISEPFALINVAEIINTPNRHVSAELSSEYFQLIRTTLLVLAKQYDKSYFIKVPGIITASLLHLAHKALPGIKELFLYRALKPTVSSFRRMTGPAFFWVIAEILLLGHPLKYRQIWKQVKVRSPQKKVFFQFLCQMHPFYLEARTRRDLKSYSFESLIRDKNGFCRSFLRDVGIGEEYDSIALSALDRDSQENSPVSRKRLLGRRDKVSLQACDWAKDIAKQYLGIEIGGDDFMITNFPNSWESYDLVQSQGYGTF